jgi:hypothetical protein
MGCRIIKTEGPVCACEPQRFNTEEEAKRALWRMVGAAKAAGGDGGPPDDGHAEWWIRNDNKLIQYRIVTECNV